MEREIAFVHLPTEIWLKILALLDIQSLLAIRQTCKGMCQVTHEKLIWLSLFEQQRHYLPIPHDLLHQEHTHFPNHTSSLIESTVRQARLIANDWPCPRTTVPWKVQRERLGSTLMGLEIFLDRWLIVIYSEGVVYLYDIQPTFTINSHGGNNPQAAAAVLRSSLVLKPGVWACSSYAISFDVMANKLVLAMAHNNPPYWLNIYGIQLGDLSFNNDMVPDAFTIIKTTTLSSHQMIRALNTKEQIVALSSASSNQIELVKWSEDPVLEQTGKKMVIKLQPEGLQDLWSGIIAIRFMGPYILTFKTRSIEFHDFMPLLYPDSSKSSAWPSLQHSFPMTFRNVSFSNCSHSHNHTSDMDTYTTTLLAYDVIQGLFQYVVELTLSSETSILSPSLQVTLVGIYPLVQYTANSALSLDQVQSMALSPLHHPWNSSERSTRGFVSTHAMGPQGKRAIWIERKRSSPVREVQVWSKQPCLAGDLDPVPLPAEIERRAVYSVHSPDLREDVTYCTFSELTGKIVLGSRSGNISILDLTR